MEGQLKQITSSFHRYMYGQISWESRMFGLVGPRGVGKSTMILQYIKEHREGRRMLYVAADHLYFSSHTLVETVDEFAMKVGFTGSSVLDIYKGYSDLSRRAPIFTMQGLSFREYLALFHKKY